MKERAREVLGMPQRRKPNKGPYWELVKIAPAIARRVLEECNTHNRRMKERTVEEIERDIRNGRWRVTHQGISFSRRGVLLDGQNRLEACARANKAIWLWVQFNQAPKNQIVMDVGGVRGPAEGLTLTENYGKVTNFEMATLHAMLRGFGTKVRLTRQEAGEALERHRPAITFAHEVMGTCSRIRGVTTGTTRGVLVRAWYSIPVESVTHFGEVLRSGMGNGSSDKVIILLRDWLMASYGGGGEKILKERHGKTERALKAHLDGENLRHLYAATRELFPLPEEISKV